MNSPENLRSGLHTANLSWQTRVDKLKLFCVNGTKTIDKHVGKLLATNRTCLFSRQLFHQLFRVGKLTSNAWTNGKNVLVTFNQSKHALYSRDLCDTSQNGGRKSRIAAGFAPCRARAPTEFAPHRFNLIKFAPNQIESHREIILRSFIHCVVRLLVARKLRKVGGELKIESS